MAADASTVLRFTGAIVAFCIGAGFATGQELSQFFVSHGYWGLGGVAVALAVYVYLCGSLAAAGASGDLEEPAHVFRHFLGQRLGRVFEWYAALLLFLLFIVMLAGAGAVFEDHYGLPNWVGRVCLLALVLTSTLLGFKRMVTLLAVLGPVIVICCLALAVAVLKDGLGNLGDGSSISEVAPTLTEAHSSWWMSGVLYASFIAIPMAVFLTTLGASAGDARRARCGGAVGGTAFGAAVLVVTLAMLASIRVVADESVPLLALAENLLPFLGSTFALILLAGIYTTATPLLWTVATGLGHGDATRTNAALLVLGAVGFAVAFTPFTTLLNLIYPTSGWVGIVFLLSIAVRQIRTPHRRTGDHEQR